MIPKSVLGLDPHKKDQDEAYKTKIKNRQEQIDSVLKLRAENNFELYQEQYNEKIQELQQQKDRMNQVQDFKNMLMKSNRQPENEKSTSIKAEKEWDNDQDQGQTFDR
jgi:glutamate synthase domain-containing protein 2